MNPWSNQDMDRETREQTKADEALLRDPDYWSNEPKDAAKRKKKAVKKQRPLADNSRRD